jgi:hypothetical protein
MQELPAILPVTIAAPEASVSAHIAELVGTAAPQGMRWWANAELSTTGLTTDFKSAETLVFNAVVAVKAARLPPSSPYRSPAKPAAAEGLACDRIISLIALGVEGQKADAGKEIRRTKSAPKPVACRRFFRRNHFSDFLIFQRHRA